MDLYLIFGGIALLIGIPLWLVTRKKNPGPEPQPEDFKDEYYPKDAYKTGHKVWQDKVAAAYAGKLTGRFALGLGVFLVLMACWVQVPTNTIGIVTSFGKPVDARPNGFQDKLPWQKVAKDFDASRQYMKFDGKGNDKAADEDGKVFSCLPVKMDREAKACLTVTIGWQMKAGSKAERDQTLELFKAHKTFARLTENFMKANAQDAAQASYNDVNPLVEGKNPGFSQLSEEMEGNLRTAVKGDVEILSVQITNADYDPATDDSIAGMQAEFAKTQKAQQLEQTNLAISKANKALQDSGKLTDEVLKDQCIKGAIAVGANPGACLQPGWGMYGTANK